MKGGFYMKMLKRGLFTILLAAAMTVSLTACGGDGDVEIIVPSNTTTTAQTTTEAKTTTTEATTEEKTEEPEETSKPEDTTDEPEDTTDEPEDTTDEPEDTTDEPEDTTDEPEETPAPTTGEKPPVVEPKGIVATVNAQIGIEFAENGCTPEDGFDSSGLIYYVLRTNGYMSCPRGINDQMTMGTKVGISDLKEGDLVFFNGEGGGCFGGIYVGNDTFVYAPYPGKPVRTGNLASAYWKSVFNTGITNY